MSNEKIVIENLKNLTLDQAVEYHRILWRGIAEEIEKGELKYRSSFLLKGNVLKKYFCLPPDSRVKYNCFLCEYTRNLTPSKIYINCDYCPLHDSTKEDDDVSDLCLNGLFNEFIYAFEQSCDDKAAKKIALEIAELPVVNRKGEE